jgi:hydrogenase maturation protein HypF
MQRRVITVRGIVQGVGFRPFVFALASRLGLHGLVRNQTGAVHVEIEGEPASIDAFVEELTRRPPPLARIDDVSWTPAEVRGESRFRIEASREDASAVFISPDVATCDACLAELMDPGDRRFRYPFLNCTHCGPRLTIITGAPYDRPNTTMAGFVMCSACRAEYEDLANRRFHAQPIACPECGPRLEALDADGEQIDAGDPLAVFVEAMRSGQIGALKGLGGYHLACDARDAAAVAELRRRKHRDEKPFAVMIRDLATALELCEASDAERELLTSPRRPIVLLRKRPGATIAENVAPGNPRLGVMLPYTPLHDLLLHDVDGAALVMTSGNRADEPIAYDDDDALERLRGIADVFLIHNRPIRVRCDDSVTRIMAGAESPVRRSRGYAPEPISLPFACVKPTLAVGGQLKATFALGRDRHAFLSHHLGDLDDFSAYRAFERDIALYEELFAVRPERIVHDLHPDYASTRYAMERAGREGVELLAVQHHHAHMAACMAEHGLEEPVIGVTFDGAGYGADGAVWGGEFLMGDYRQFRRAAHLRYVAMPGGEQAIREPWRMAVAHLTDAEAECEPFTSRFPAAELRTIGVMLARRLNSPLTSSAGRLFDAVAALAGVRDRVRYEGQAAMELEWLASDVARDEAYPFELGESAASGEEAPSWIIDTRPLVHAVAEEAYNGTNAARIARRFHATMVEVIAAVCGRIRATAGLNAVVLSGGVFMNALLAAEAAARLRDQGIHVYQHRRVPPNDGGLSLGQLAIAAANVGHSLRE